MFATIFFTICIQRMLTVYEFYVQYCADETIDLDLKIMDASYSYFSISEKSKKLRSSLIAYGDTNTWMSLLLESIETKYSAIRLRVFIEKVFAEVEEERRKTTALSKPRTQILLCDTRSLQSFLSEEYFHTRQNCFLLNS